MRIPLSTLGFVALNLFVAGAIITRLTNGSQSEALRSTAARPLPDRVISALDVPTPVDVSAIQAQAPFHKSRTFYVPPPQPTQVQPPPDYRFAGAMVLPNKSAKVVLVHNRTSVRTTVTTGDQLDGWSVTEVGPNRVLVSLGDRTVEISAAGRAQAGGMTLVSSSSPRPPGASGMVRVPVNTNHE
jgi:hypothetical protein